MNSIVKNDLRGGFVFYPGSATDFRTIVALRNYFGSKYSTYVMCDANRGLLPDVGYQGAHPVNDLENKMGLAGLQIQSSIKAEPIMEVSGIADHITQNLNQLQGEEKEKYELYLSGIFDSCIHRYRVRLFSESERNQDDYYSLQVPLPEYRSSKEDTFVIYFIKYEAWAVISWLLENLQSKASCALVLKGLGGGWMETGNLIMRLLETYQSSIGNLPNHIITSNPLLTIGNEAYNLVGTLPFENNTYNVFEK